MGTRAASGEHAVRILIVDDSVVMRMILERGLRRAGLETAEMVHAGDGMEALEALEANEAQGRGFDLILTDIHMPRLDGPALLAEARRRGLAQGVPVMMISAQDASEGTNDGLGGRMERLVKPFTMEQMMASLEPLLRAA
jgi:two-component system chemotaxis response regulator CheY